MKIIWDGSVGLAKRVVIIDDGGVEHVAGCYEIKVEITRNGKPHQEMKYSRWGNIQKRLGIHKSVQDSLDGKKSGEAT